MKVGMIFSVLALCCFCTKQEAKTAVNTLNTGLTIEQEGCLLAQLILGNSDPTWLVSFCKISPDLVGGVDNVIQVFESAQMQVWAADGLLEDAGPDGGKVKGI